MLEQKNEKWEQDIEWVMTSITIGQGFKSGKAGAFRYFRTTLPRMPAEPFFWRSRESSKIFVEHVWPAADYK